MTNEVSSYVASNPKYFPWFKDCIGAIDGTHISAWVPADRQTSFRGTTNDARVFLDALTRPEVNFPWPSEGKYYVVGFWLSLYIWIFATILRMMPCYKPSRQPSIVVACCTLHNWIRLSTRNDKLFREYEVEDLSIEGEEESTSSKNHSIDLSDENAVAMAACRDQIAEVMWANYINVNP
ncbi:hypothetical protein CK203_084612 [Vitis vinifera]|uniref:DDE Tnp4 domain-containing protein n=1 Tax=Vitis vinifera TaxID=29760 RepID=A0A438DK71_VITVI|nr:hypothetical protein CK203_084612 [Vitis vinifera]